MYICIYKKAQSFYYFTIALTQKSWTVWGKNPLSSNPPVETPSCASAYIISFCEYVFILKKIYFTKLNFIFKYKLVLIRREILYRLKYVKTQFVLVPKTLYKITHKKHLA